MCELQNIFIIIIISIPMKNVLRLNTTDTIIGTFRFYINWSITGHRKIRSIIFLTFRGTFNHLGFIMKR